MKLCLCEMHVFSYTTTTLWPLYRTNCVTQHPHPVNNWTIFWAKFYCGVACTISIPLCFVYNNALVEMCADKEGKVESSVSEDKTVKSDESYENICRHIVGKCSFLLLAVQPAMPGKDAFILLSAVFLIRTWYCTLLNNRTFLFAGLAKAYCTCAPLVFMWRRPAFNLLPRTRKKQEK